MFLNSKILNAISVIVLIISFAQISEALLRRCFQCRSRGERGSCKDPFKFNATEVEDEPGILAIPCASGWCGKVMEGGGTYSTDDFDLAIQRMCVQRGPDDNEDRCAYTTYNYKKVYMCFCQGDLCNSSKSKTSSSGLILTGMLVFASISFIVKRYF